MNRLWPIRSEAVNHLKIVHVLYRNFPTLLRNTCVASLWIRLDLSVCFRRKLTSLLLAHISHLHSIIFPLWNTGYTHLQFFTLHGNIMQNTGGSPCLKLH